MTGTALPNTFRKMTDEKVIKRSDAEKINYFDIHIEPGFNPEGRTEDCDEDDEDLFNFIKSHGVLALPQWEVRPRQDGGVFIVDGHRRFAQTGRAIKEGHFKADAKTGLYLIPIKQFGGNDLDRLYRIGTSNKKKDLTPLQFAELCKRAFHGFGQKPAQIAEGFGCSVTAVTNALILASANNDVQQMVKSGQVSATTAIKIQHNSGEDAGPILQKKLEKAKEKGQKKLMPKDFKPKGATKRDLDIAEAVRTAVLDLCRATVSGEAYDAALDLDLAEVIAKEIK